METMPEPAVIRACLTFALLAMLGISGGAVAALAFGTPQIGRAPRRKAIVMWAAALIVSAASTADTILTR